MRLVNLIFIIALTGVLFGGCDNISGSGKEETTYVVSTKEEMLAALDSIRSNTDASGQFVIDIAKSFPLESTNINAALTIMSSSNEEKTIRLSGTGSLFTVESSATLTLRNNVTLRRCPTRLHSFW